MTFLFLYTYLVYVYVCVGTHPLWHGCGGQPMGVSSLLLLCGYHSRSLSVVVRFGSKCLSMLNHHSVLHYDTFYMPMCWYFSHTHLLCHSLLSFVPTSLCP